MSLLQKYKRLAQVKGVVPLKTGPLDPSTFWLKRRKVRQEEFDAFTLAFEEIAPSILSRYDIKNKELQEYICEQASAEVEVKMRKQLGIIPELILSWLFRMLLTAFLQWLIEELLNERPNDSWKPRRN
jgi:hypothetical protein